MIKAIRENDTSVNYLVGVTLDRHDNERDVLLRFIRIYFALEDVEKILRKIGTYITEDASFVIKTEHATEEQNKRIKL